MADRHHTYILIVLVHILQLQPPATVAFLTVCYIAVCYKTKKKGTNKELD